MRLVKELHAQDPALYNSFGVFRSNMMSLVAPDGGLDFYDGALRARDEAGELIFDQVDYRDYPRYLREEVKPWSYMVQKAVLTAIEALTYAHFWRKGTFFVSSS